MNGRRFLFFLVLSLVILLPTAGLGVTELVLDGYTITDANGRRITVTKPFERIISLYGAHTENLFELGAGGQVVGVPRHADWPAAARSKPVHSYHDDVERFLAARPDLVLIRPMIDRGYSRLVRRLEANGIVVASLQPSSIEQMFVYWRILGVLAGRKPAAEEMVSRFKKSVRRIRIQTDRITNKKRVYFEAIHDRMRTFSPSAMPIFVLETAGGINVAGDAVPRRGTNIADYGKERILSRGREIDVYLAQFGPMNRPTVESIKAEPGYDLIRAVQRNSIFVIDEKLVSRPTMRLLAGICRIGKMLYPDYFIAGELEAACLPLPDGRVGNAFMKEERP
ncbi:ABC transporter substrate-binding protein [Desulfosarcina widdelii]|uniref:ABC transporter substrate-binding protein n=1 Tax=Desulfosarcina widdelii TaxID=947919 RepID=A0A5K7Z4P5_9BACT|nr:ABC transporter substrate-binding protein [Desulfosarcina widdelii]BBO75978.1 ABC transporter substrate-binding protein [Desulfosarcina widdelii]